VEYVGFRLHLQDDASQVGGSQGLGLVAAAAAVAGPTAGLAAPAAVAVVVAVAAMVAVGWRP
jgi:hypothetical protein